MDKDKLNKAAEDATYCQDNITANYAIGHCKGFKRGASWLMQQPLSERLTEEEKEKITDMYNNMESFRKCSTNPIMIGLFLSLQITVENIFGTDLFPNQPTAI